MTGLSLFRPWLVSCISWFPSLDWARSGLASTPILPKTVRVKKFIALVVLVVAGWFYFHQTPATWRGMPAAKDPVQLATKLPAAFVQQGYTIQPLAQYQVTAVVLSRERYRNDRNAELCPVDLALGWGPMSIAKVINDLSISQSGRWYEYRYPGEPPLEPADIASHSANTHCLPANDGIRSKLLAVKRHEVVSLEGYLVEATADDGWRWRSSLTRTDTGGGACEVLWVTGVSSRKL
jgi:hypothetical protein